MRGVNKAIIVGNIGQDPETKYSQSGLAITTISVATSESWNDKQSGEKQERTEWHRVKMFGKLAEIAGEYLKKGRQVYIEGSLRTDKYTDKEGVERYSTNIIADTMQMLGGNPEGGQGGGQGNQGGQKRQGGGDRSNDDYGQPRGQSNFSGGQGDNRSPRERAAATQGGGRPAQSNAPANEGFDDDDIPF